MMNFRNTRNAIKKSMEEDDMMSYDGSNGSFIDSDDDHEFQPVKRSRTITNDFKDPVKSVQRRPTRVPNLKIQNRNAILARENRMRKKMLMEELEKTNDELQAENRKLQKIMKVKDRKNEELMKEVRYLKSVIANRTEIVTVLKSLPKSIGSVKKEEQQEKPVLPAYSVTASSETLSCDISEENDIATEWDEILKNPLTSDFSDIPKLEISSPNASPTSSGVSSEHNYFYDDKILESLDDEEIEESAGICVHINRGKVSLEFCAVCHNNATTTTNSWID